MSVWKISSEELGVQLTCVFSRFYEGFPFVRYQFFISFSMFRWEMFSFSAKKKEHWVLPKLILLIANAIEWK